MSIFTPILIVCPVFNVINLYSEKCIFSIKCHETITIKNQTPNNKMNSY